MDQDDSNGTTGAHPDIREFSPEGAAIATSPNSRELGSAPTGDLNVEQLFASVLSEVRALRGEFTSKLLYDDTKQQQLDTMHKELQAHREGLLFRALRPVLLDLIALYDDVGKQVEAAKAPSDSPSSSVETSAWSVVHGAIAEILGRNGAEPFVADGESGGARRQRVINIIPTSDPSQDGIIARRLRPGFAYEDRVLRPEWVEVYRYAPAGDSTTKESASHE